VSREAPSVEATATELRRVCDRVYAAAQSACEACERLGAATGTRDEERAVRELEARNVLLRSALDELARVQHRRTVSLAHDPTTWGQR